MKMKTMVCLTASLALANAVPAQVNVTVDPGATWLGYMSVSDTDPDGGGFQFGSSWGFADLDASFSGSILTLAPNTSIARDNPTTDGYWFDDSSGTLLGNKKMQATGYVEDTSLLGQTVNFNYEVLTNTLDGSITETGSYSAVAFIKILDSNAGFALVDSVSAPLTTGANTLSLAVPNTAGYIPQYGFEMVGDNAPTVSNTLGSVTVVPEPSTYALFFGLAVLGFAWTRRRRS